MSAAVQSCAECGRELFPNVPPGLCPSCALRDVLKRANNRSGDSGEAPPVHIGGYRSFGDYELLEEIARGGMGIVYKSRQVSLDRIVAVKLLLLGQYASEEFIHRFRIEASVAASLQHPNIVAIHEVGVHQGQHYFVMDFVDGPDLAQLVREQPLAAKRAAGYVKTIAEAIHFAHTRRILHRDLKPSNVLIDSNDQPRVTDFGLAKNLANESDLTLTGKVVGSPSFMPPEQALGERGKMASASDIYSLGAILYHALTGRPPFMGETLNATLQQVESKEPIAPRLLVPGIPADLETICLKCLEKEPGKRFQTALKLAEELARFLRGEPIQSRPVSAPEKVWRWCRRKPALASLGAATCLLLLAVGIGSPIAILRISQARRQAEQNLYAANMKLAFNALELNNRGQVLRLLERHQPKKPGDPDVRGWEWRYLWKQTRSDELFALPESKHDIQCVAFSPDGKYLAASEGFGRISVWDLATTQRVAQCENPRGPGVLEFSSDGRHLANANFKDGLWMWDWNPPHLTFRGPPPNLRFGVNGIEVRDGIVTAVHLNGQRLRRWELTSMRELSGFPIVSKFVKGFVGYSAFSSDGRLLATKSDKGVFLWNRQTGAKLTELIGSDVTGCPLAFSPDNRLFVTGGVNGTCEVWETETFRKAASFSAHASQVDKGNFSRDGSRFVTAGCDHTLKVWDTSDWPKPTNEWRKPVTLLGHLEEVLDAAFSPDGKHIASASTDGTVRFWSASAKPRPENFKPLPPDIRSGIDSWSLSPGGQWLFLIFTNDTFSLWNLKSWEESPRQPLPSGNIKVAALFADGRRVALGDADGTVKILDLATMMVAPMQTGFSNVVHKVSCSADGSTIVAQGYADQNGMHTVKAWQVATGHELATFTAEWNLSIDRIPISPDGRFVVTAGFDGPADFWELPGASKRTLVSDKRCTTGVAFFSDGRVATCSADKTAQVWELAPQRSLLKVYSDQSSLRSITLSPDGRLLAAGDDLGAVMKVKVWDLATSQEVAVLSGHNEAIIDLAFWPDGNTIVSVSEDRVSVWRAASFAEIDAHEKGRQADARPFGLASP
jgi:WD40 repeat protein